MRLISQQGLCGLKKELQTNKDTVAEVVDSPTSATVSQNK